jgi:hypothetical protein
MGAAEVQRFLRRFSSNARGAETDLPSSLGGPAAYGLGSGITSPNDGRTKAGSTASLRLLAPQLCQRFGPLLAQWSDAEQEDWPHGGTAPKPEISVAMREKQPTCPLSPANQRPNVKSP